VKTKKVLTLCLTAGLVAGMLALPAEAKKKKPKPVASTLYLEGVSNFGEEDQTGTGTYLKLQNAAGSGEKSMGFFNGVASPNTKCAGNSLMPVFVGSVSGQIVGDMKISFNTLGTPGKAQVRVWPDVAGQACNDAYIEPAASVDVDLPAGKGLVEAVLEDVNFQAGSLMMVQVTPILGAPAYYSRVLYGTEDSKVEFSCIPASGKTCTP